MSTPFEDAVEHTLVIEGVFSDDSDDLGGKTKYGITEKIARAWGYTGPMTELPIGTARLIYREWFWEDNHLEELATLDRAVAAYLFDMFVNHKPGTATEIAQRACNALEPDSSKILVVDGAWGAKTQKEIERMARKWPLPILGALKGERYRYYLGRIIERPSQAKYIRGWVKRCA